jgi:hypothetical protein
MNAASGGFSVSVTGGEIRFNKSPDESRLCLASLTGGSRQRSVESIRKLDGKCFHGISAAENHLLLRF